MALDIHATFAHAGDDNDHTGAREVLIQPVAEAQRFDLKHLFERLRRDDPTYWIEQIVHASPACHLDQARMANPLTLLEQGARSGSLVQQRVLDEVDAFIPPLDINAALSCAASLKLPDTWQGEFRRLIDTYQATQSAYSLFLESLSLGDEVGYEAQWQTLQGGVRQSREMIPALYSPLDDRLEEQQPEESGQVRGFLDNCGAAVDKLPDALAAAMTAALTAKVAEVLPDAVAAKVAEMLSDVVATVVAAVTPAVTAAVSQAIVDTPATIRRDVPVLVDAADLMRRKDIIKEFPFLERYVKDTEGELAGIASCTRLVEEGKITMPEDYNQEGFGYWLRFKVEAYAQRKMAEGGGVVVPMKRNTRRHKTG